ncbi:hypothetical protein HMPREF2916_10920 [Staphylococcus sp. HMSC068D05]|nr:hypothetical protein HMPREF2916_10920 [Staphylococcus sp. HMSC068D05]
MTRSEKAWYQRICTPVNYCQYSIQRLKHNVVPDSGFFIDNTLYDWLLRERTSATQLALFAEMLVAFLFVGAPPQLALFVEMLVAFLFVGAPPQLAVFVYFTLYSFSIFDYSNCKDKRYN